MLNTARAKGVLAEYQTHPATHTNEPGSRRRRVRFRTRQEGKSRYALSCGNEEDSMRYSIRTTLGICLLIVAAGCQKKETSAPATTSTSEAKDGVSSVPPPAERATDLSPVDLPLAGAVKEVKAKVLDKEADDKGKGLVRIKVFDLEGPVDVSENTRWGVWKPGSDPEEQKPEITAWASNEQAVTPGTWDLRLHYEESQVCKGEGWIRN